ncbi:uncharacterized protein LOC129613197 [Condylostylus longicornis]|uniref:uncharacterized protein LOC129613197 n=1 Tax=Condylostylus longicornis TaxID=2530218 RepID=UPI00244DB351|nr:uncharacterized protein LOC129613197 [Condylostylus longicornis]
MTNTKILSKSFKIIIFLHTITIPTFGLISCPKEYLFQIGTETKCYSSDEKSISCHSPVVKKASIDCNDDYFNHLHEQEIKCNLNNGEWSRVPLRCFPPQTPCEKHENPEKIEIIKDRTKFMPWYVEILRRPPINGEQNVFPGVIISGRMIMTSEKYFNKTSQWDLLNFVVRVYKSNSYEDHRIERIEYRQNDPLYYHGFRGQLFFEPICILILTIDNYIKMDKETQTACIEYEKPFFEENRWFIEIMKAVPENNLSPENTGHCIVPEVNKQKYELMCYSNLSNNSLTECYGTSPMLQGMCAIGYEKKNSNTETDDPLWLCVGGRWSSENANILTSDSCELICGETDNDLDFDSDSHDNVKNAPWHVAIYTNSSEQSYEHEPICSGTIIHKNIVISAAHCFYNMKTEQPNNPSNYLVGAGKRLYSFRKTEKSEQFLKVADIQYPRMYNKAHLENDVAVLILSSNFVYNSLVKPVCIDWISNWNHDLKNEIDGLTFGWRIKSEDASSNAELKQINLKALTKEQCKLKIENSEVSDEIFCAASNITNVICKGDSGAGFVVKKRIGSKERYVLWGILSSETNKELYCSGSLINLFANIRHFQDQIKTIINRNRSNINKNKLSELIWHQLYAHNIFTTLSWIKKELNLRYLPKEIIDDGE